MTARVSLIANVAAAARASKTNSVARSPRRNPFSMRRESGVKRFSDFDSFRMKGEKVEGYVGRKGLA